MNYNIFIYTETDSWKKICMVVDGIIINLTDYGLPEVVHNVNNEIFKQINSIQGTQNTSAYYNNSKILGPEDDKMEILFLETLRYRRSTVYLIIQFSQKTNQLRIMAYGADQVLHSGYGTSLSEINKEDLINHIKKNINERITKDPLQMSQNVCDKLKKSDYIFFI